MVADEVLSYKLHLSGLLYILLFGSILVTGHLVQIVLRGNFFIIDVALDFN